MSLSYKKYKNYNYLYDTYENIMNKIQYVNKEINYD